MSNGLKKAKEALVRWHSDCPRCGSKTSEESNPVGCPKCNLILIRTN